MPAKPGLQGFDKSAFAPCTDECQHYSRASRCFLTGIDKSFDHTFTTLCEPALLKEAREAQVMVRGLAQKVAYLENTLKESQRLDLKVAMMHCPTKSTMNVMSERAPLVYAEVLHQRHGEPAKEGLLTWDSFLQSERPECQEPDCDGVIVLPRDSVTFALKDEAYCLLCGRKYKVSGVPVQNSLEGSSGKE